MNRGWRDRNLVPRHIQGMAAAQPVNPKLWRILAVAPLALGACDADLEAGEFSGTGVASSDQGDHGDDDYDYDYSIECDAGSYDYPAPEPEPECQAGEVAREGECVALPTIPVCGW